ELGPRIAARLLELPQDIAHRRQPETLIRVLRSVELLERARIAEYLPHRTLQIGEDPLDDRIRFGVHGRGIERIVAVHDAQESGRLFVRFLAEPRHLLEALAAREWAVGIS